MQIATRAWAFGMNVTGVDPEDKPISPMIKRIVKPDQTRRGDARTPTWCSSPRPIRRRATRWWARSEFELMKKNSYFIAVSRGGIYDLARSDQGAR